MESNIWLWVAVALVFFVHAPSLRLRRQTVLRCACGCERASMSADPLVLGPPTPLYRCRRCGVVYARELYS